METPQQSIGTFSDWILSGLRADLAPEQAAPASPLPAFFANLYDDMLANPGRYHLPEEPYIPFIARLGLSPEENARHTTLKAARLRARKAIFAYLEFLFQLGEAGVLLDGTLELPRSEFDKLASAAAKKIKSQQWLTALERQGLVFALNDPVGITYGLSPLLLASLVSFSQACARVKDYDFYFFRRADLAVLEGKRAPDFTDALRLAPEPFQGLLVKTDEWLTQLRFKREIFADQDVSYRLRYTSKGEVVVYWCRIREAFQPEFFHYLRWPLESGLTARVFNRLEETTPGLAEIVFQGLMPCEQCFGEHCQAMARVAWNGTVREVCKELGWNQIEATPSDYERLWMVVEALNCFVVGKKERCLCNLV